MATQKQNKAILTTGFIIGIIGVILATLLLCKHGFPELCTSSFGCSIEGVDGCQRLGESSESKIFGLIPIAFFGLIYYVFLTAVIGWQLKKLTIEKAALFLYATIFGLAVDAVLGYINFTQILTPCILCAYTYLITLALFILALTHYLQMSRSMSRSKKKPNFGVMLQEMMNPALVGLAVPLLISFTFWSIDRMKAPTEVADNLLAENKVEITLEDLSALKEVNLNLTGIRSVEGAENGYIVIQKFADFLCPHCYHASQLLQEAMKRWPGRIKVYYRHFPLDSTCNPELHGKPNKPIGDWRCNGAQAAICAADFPKFPEYYHGIF
ncbi:MAG: DsbA family protein, partial [Leptonema sp. (in: Bacteria)]|nr:DsbA family protein [Leptonema sp. (in: bacteria)]